MNKSLVCVAFILSGLGGARPEVTLSTVATAPRLHMIGTDERTHWRTWGSYRQDLGPILSVQSHFELGSENFRFRNPFRIHDMLARVTLGSHAVRLGRMTHWSGLVQARVDGAEYSLEAGKLGLLTVLGGFPSVADFSGTAFSQNSLLLVSWGQGRPGKNLSVTAWSQRDTLQAVSYVGSTWNTLLFARIRVTAALAWNFTDGEVHYARVSGATRMGNHRLRLGIRNNRSPVSKPYPWVDAKIVVPAAVTLSVTSSLAERRTWWNQLVHRLGNEPASYLSSSFYTGVIHFNVLAGFQGDRKLFGGGGGITRKITSSVSSGVQVNVNAVDYGDLIDPRPSSSVYGWLSWTPIEKVTLRFSGQFNTNPFYESDGRAGLAIHGTL